jgi:fructose-1,6-bisphosphatase/inositol monophosphatase family enzyme
VSWCRGSAPRRNGRPCAPSAAAALEGGTRVLLAPRQEWALPLHQRCLAPARISVCASTAYRIALVTAGAAEAAVHLMGRLRAWDLAAALALAEAAGCPVTDVAGRRIAVRGDSVHPLGEPSCFAAVPGLLEPLLTRYRRPCEESLFERLLAERAS